MNICDNAEKCKTDCLHRVTHLNGPSCHVACTAPGGVWSAKCREVPVEVLTSENSWLVTRKDFGKLLAESGSIIAEALKKIGLNITDYYNIIPGPGLRKAVEDCIHGIGVVRFIEQIARNAVRELLDEVMDEVMCRKDD